MCNAFRSVSFRPQAWRRTGRVLRVIGAASLLAVSGGAAYAQNLDPFGTFRSSFTADDRRPVERRGPAVYEAERHGLRFVFDPHTHPPLVRFENDGEILALSARPAARGQTVYTLLDGRDLVLLRRSSLGALTAYPRADEIGEATVYVRRSEGPLRLEDMDADGVERLASDVASRLSERIERDLSISYSRDALFNAQERAVLADALRTTELALSRLGARSLASEVDHVSFVAASQVGAQIESDRLIVRYDPSQDHLGRPSSLAILRAMGKMDAWPGRRASAR